VTGWRWQRPFVIATPSALRFIDRPALEAQTGAPVRSEYKEPGSPDVLPPAEAIVVGGASFNTINKWAAGISDTLALGLLTEGVGLGLPLAALPFLNAAQAAHPAFGRSVKELREAGVKSFSDRKATNHTCHTRARNTLVDIPGASFWQPWRPVKAQLHASRRRPRNR
jgi:phosphopantothenoylcysteine synthetase/decarboxylase